MLADLIPPDRLPPQSKEAEMCVIGAMLRDRDCIDDVFLVVGLDEFYYDAHRKVAAAVSDLHAAGSPADMPSVMAELQRRGYAADVGAEYLAELFDCAPTAANAPYYAGIVRERATRRRLIHLANEVLRDAYEGPTPADDLLAEFEQRLFDLGTGHAAGRVGEPADLAEVVLGVCRRIDDRATGRAGPEPFVRSGFDALDHLIGGFRRGRLYVVAARTSVGKSAITTAFVINAAAAGVNSLVFSLEMDRDELAERVLAIRSGVPLNRITGAGRVTEGEAGHLAAAAGGFGATVLVDDRADQSTARIASATRRAVRAKKVGLVVVDYLQLLAPVNPRDPRHLQVAQDARRLKVLARQCEVPVILVAQLNRTSEDRPEGKPRLADLKDSAGIEDNADAVLMLYREPGGSPASAEQSIGCVLGKQRGGPSGEFTLSFCRPCVRFENRGGIVGAR